jgi:pyridoxal phosphate enzyme (YggS family)
VEPIRNPTLTAELIRARRDALMARFRVIAAQSGYDPDRIRLVAVTKGFGPEVARLAYDAGLSSLGENRVQEALPKIAAVPGVEWHLVGHLQSNKVRPALAGFAWIHSVDSVPLLRRIDAIAHDDGRHPVVLLQVNVTDEATKSGFAEAWFGEAARPGGELAIEVARIGRTRVAGLMTIAAAGASTDEARATFRRLRELRDLLQEGSGIALPELSMGMTADADSAVAEGATIVRIGTALFGPRPG